jgi:hypothetical protein
MQLAFFSAPPYPLPARMNRSDGLEILFLPASPKDFILAGRGEEFPED